MGNALQNGIKAVSPKNKTIGKDQREALAKKYNEYLEGNNLKESSRKQLNNLASRGGDDKKVDADDFVALNLPDSFTYQNLVEKLGGSGRKLGAHRKNSRADAEPAKRGMMQEGSEKAPSAVSPDGAASQGDTAARPQDAAGTQPVSAAAQEAEQKINDPFLKAIDAFSKSNPPPQAGYAAADLAKFLALLVGVDPNDPNALNKVLDKNTLTQLLSRLPKNLRELVAASLSARPDAANAQLKLSDIAQEIIKAVDKGNKTTITLDQLKAFAKETITANDQAGAGAVPGANTAGAAAAAGQQPSAEQMAALQGGGAVAPETTLPEAAV